MIYHEISLLFAVTIQFLPDMAFGATGLSFPAFHPVAFFFCRVEGTED